MNIRMEKFVKSAKLGQNSKEETKLSDKSMPIPGRVVGSIDGLDNTDSGMIVRTDGTIFSVGSEVDVYLRHMGSFDAGWAWMQLRMALQEVEERIGNHAEVLLRVTHCPDDDSRWAAKSSGMAWAYGSDPIAAIDALARSVKPCPHNSALFINGAWEWGNQVLWRVPPGGTCPDCDKLLPPAPLKSPDDMTKAECEAELNAAEGVAWQVAPYETGEGGSYSWRWAIIVGAELLPKPAYSQRGYASEEWALRYAVRSLRAHFVDTLEGRESVVG